MNRIPKTAVALAVLGLAAIPIAFAQDDTDSREQPAESQDMQQMMEGMQGDGMRMMPMMRMMSQMNEMMSNCNKMMQAMIRRWTCNPVTASSPTIRTEARSRAGSTAGPAPLKDT